MKYSKMMTILENSRSDLENEDFFNSNPKKTGRTLKARLNELKKEKSKASKKDITLFSSPIKTCKSPNSSSIVFINSANFLQNPLNSSKSMSMSFEFSLEEKVPSHFEFLMEEDDIYKNQDKDSLIDSDEEFESPVLRKERFGDKKFTLSMAEKDLTGHLKKMGKNNFETSVIINKKVVYYDEEGRKNFRVFIEIFILGVQR